MRPPATTLNIPGMTKSRVSPDGKIAQRDVGSKLVIIMVGLPARGKSYITKKIQRYLSWQQHETRIFNVGNRRRVAASAASEPIPGSSPRSSRSPQRSPKKHPRGSSIMGVVGGLTHEEITQTAQILLNGIDTPVPDDSEDEEKAMETDGMDQTAEFFDPANKKAAQIRERVAMGTLNELLDFLLVKGGSVGILDATNSTLERRTVVYNAIKEREPKLGILFIESICEDEKVGPLSSKFAKSSDTL
jgi:6-phosphofructo-2-kinase